MKTYSLKKTPQDCCPLNHTTMPSSSRTCSYPNEPRLTHSTPSNIKPAKSSLKNFSRQGKSPFQNPPKQHPSSLSRRRKQGNYDPVKTTSTSIAIPSRMSTSFPSSLTSSTNYEDCWFSPNLMYNGDITTSSSNPKTDGGPPLPPH